MDPRRAVTTLTGVALGTLALFVGIIVSGLTYFLLAPVIVVALPVLYAIWRIRRAARIEEEDRVAHEPHAVLSEGGPLVETVMRAEPKEARHEPTSSRT